MRRKTLGIFILIFLIHPVFCQDPKRFQAEIDVFKADTTDYTAKGNLILFAGSSSIRMWTDLQADFPGKTVLNRGFGGSVMSDLLYYIDTVIIQYRPVMIFIYEGDNDISSGKKPEEILQSAGKLVDRIRKKLPNSTICFISAKPSILRWKLKDSYTSLNKQLMDFTQQRSNVFYLDVWGKMLDSGGNLRADLFLDDGLHMNRKGYDIWKEAVSVFLSKHPVPGRA